jgi:hypothetical protein
VTYKELVNDTPIELHLKEYLILLFILKEFGNEKGHKVED